MAVEIPKKIDSSNIFILIQDLLSKQKHDGRRHGKMLVLSVVERQNMQYQKYLDNWAQKSEELKDARAMEFEKLEKDINSKGGWFIGGLIVGAIILGVVAGALLAGPGGAVAGAKLGAMAGAAAGGVGVTIGVFSDKGMDNPVFFDKNKEFDPLKSKERDTEMERITRESKHVQDKANVKQGEISRTIQIDLETIQQVLTSLSNVIVRFAELQGKTSNMMK